jgi:acetyl esterase/lipase
MIEKLKSIHLIWLYLLLVIPATGQQILSKELIGERSREQLTAEFSFPAFNGIKLYKINYLTEGIDELPDTASGLFVLPTEGSVKGIIGYQHGTTDGPMDVPSRLTGGSSFPMVYGGQGFAVSAADYLGLGNSRGFHPYVHAATEARAGIDMLLASIQAGGHENVFFNNIFIAGYSQGGHAAMAMAQAIQERVTDDLWVTAAAPMSGPYDLSGVMTDLVLSDSSYSFVAYMVYLLLGYQEAEGDIYEELEEIIRPQFIDDVLLFQDGTIGLFDLNDRLIDQLILDFGSSIPKLVFREDFIDEFATDTSHVIRQMLRENDTYRFVPDFPMRLYYCTSDEQVPFMNSLVAEESMNKNGAEDVQAFNLSSAATHAQCAIPAFLSSAAFFASLVLTDTKDFLAKEMQIEIAPNPNQGIFRIKSSAPDSPATYQIIDALGQSVVVLRSKTNALIDLSGLSPGMYHCIMQWDGDQLQGTFIIQ